MGAFANAAFRRYHSKVTNTVRIGDEFRHPLQPHRNLRSNLRAEGRRRSKHAAVEIAWRSILFGRLAGRFGSRTRVEVALWPSSESVFHCPGFAGLGVSLMNVPEDSAFGAGEIRPETMSGSTGTVGAIIFPCAAGATGSTGADRATTIA